MLDGLLGNLPALLAPYSGYILCALLLSEALAVLPLTKSNSLVQLAYNGLKKLASLLGLKRPE